MREWTDAQKRSAIALAKLLLIALGFVLLTFSAKEAINRIIRLARHAGVSEFVISFVVVGTLAVFPELSIGVNAAIRGDPSFGLGIILGSNVIDLTVIIGLVALFANGIILHSATIRQSAWFLFAAILPVVLFLDHELSRADGLVLLGAYAFYVIRMFSRRHHAHAEVRRTEGKPYADALVLIAAVAVLVFAGGLVSDNAEALGVQLGIPLTFLGTILAVGTCLPELTFAVQASNARHGEMGFGNILGNVFADCLMTLGLVSVIHPIAPRYPQIGLLTGAFMVFAMTLVVILFNKQRRITRWHGAALILLYIAFLALETIVEHSLVP